MLILPNVTAAVLSEFESSSINICIQVDQTTTPPDNYTEFESSSFIFMLHSFLKNLKSSPFSHILYILMAVWDMTQDHGSNLYFIKERRVCLPEKCQDSTRLHGYHNPVLRDQGDLFSQASKKKVVTNSVKRATVCCSFLTWTYQGSPNYKNTTMLHRQNATSSAAQTAPAQPHSYKGAYGVRPLPN